MPTIIAVSLSISATTLGKAIAIVSRSATYLIIISVNPLSAEHFGAYRLYH